MDAFTSSGRIGLAVWAWGVLGAWVSDGRFAGHVSLRDPRSCLALGNPFWGKLGVPSGLCLRKLGGVHAALPWVGYLEVLYGSYHNHLP